MKYAHFLLENYYPIHEMLCEASGQLISDYICEKADKCVVEALEKRVSDFEKVFWGY